MQPSRLRRLSYFFLFFVLAAGVFALLRTPFAGWKTGETLPTGRMLSPVTGGEVPFTFDPNDTSMTQPQAGTPVEPVDFNGSILDLPQSGPGEKSLGVEFEPANFENFDPDFIDPVLQLIASEGEIPGPATSWAGLDLNNWGAGWPPDTNGDVGPNHYIQTVNTSILIYNKNGTQVPPFTFDTLFNGTGTPCDNANKGDPVVVYDDVSNRWVITDFAWSNIQSGPYYECIAVSKTGDPVNGGWYFYALDTWNNEQANRFLNDYPKLGVWHDGIYMTANMFDCLNSNCSSASFEGVKIWALKRADMVNGAPLNYQYAGVGTAFFSLLPANARGNSMPPAGTPNYLGAVHFANASVFRTWKFSVNWNNPGSSSLTGPFDTTVASYVHAANVPQLAGPNLDALSGRLMAQLQYSTASGTPALWVTHSVSTSGRAGLRWYELRNLGGTPTVFQQGTYSPDTTHRWMGALAVDQSGNMAIIFSASSSAMHPQIRYAGRLATDLLGTLNQGEATLIAGNGSQSNTTRWGDYAGMALDPTDQCTFWFTTEYYNATGNNWQTRIGSFTFPTCGQTNHDNEIFLPIILRP